MKKKFSTSATKTELAKKGFSYKWRALSCTSIGGFFSLASANTITIALKDIIKDLNVSIGLVTWIVMVYMFVVTISVPMFAKISDTYGRKKLFESGLLLFACGSLFAGFSFSGYQIILARVVQSFGTALILANSVPIIADSFPENEIGKALGINSMMVNTSYVFAPILGGFLCGIGGWRAVFLGNVPIALLALLWSVKQLKEQEFVVKEHIIDWKGSIFFTISMFLFLLVINLGGFIGWLSHLIIGLALLSIIFGLLFYQVEKKSSEPMIDLSLIRNIRLLFAYLCIFLSSTSRGTITFLLVIYFQLVKNIDPVLIGLTFLPYCIAITFIAPISGSLSDKYGERGLSSAGLLIMAFGFIGLGMINLGTSTWLIVFWMFLIGIGFGMFNSPNTSSIMKIAPVDKRAVASGIRTMFLNSGSAISIALCISIVSSFVSNENLKKLFVGMEISMQEMSYGQFINGLKTTFIIAFCLCIIAVLLSFSRKTSHSYEKRLSKKENITLKH
ncbi:MAG: MFS transporter [Peptococcaceae bacterium]|nr:MFS transporter [Peptococcaceae bacterium]